jgi:hypothetical protein
MASTALQWGLRFLLLVTGLLTALAAWYLASWIIETTNPLRHELLMGTALAVVLALPFSIASIVLTKWKRQEVSDRLASLVYAVAGVIVAYLLVIAFVN